MKTTFGKWAMAMICAGSILMIQSCSKSNDNAAVGSGTVDFQITDTPSDDADVKGVIVTIADLKVDGQSVSGFTKQSVDLKAFQEGAVKLLGTTTLSAKTYNNLTLVIDVDADANGSAPGSYVLNTSDTKYKLRTSGTINITLNNTWTVSANSKSTVILDFDIRKAIKKVSDDAVRYNFVSDDNLQASIRLMGQENVGTITGSYAEQIDPVADKIVVYAYKKGTFDAGVESQPQGSDAILFKNAVTSAEVKGSLNAKTFKLAFIEKGDYELHFASYSSDGASHFTLKSLLQSTITGTGTVSNVITVQAGITVSVSAIITGI